jgi:acetolactate synthase-1/2/3 large subunit
MHGGDLVVQVLQAHGVQHLFTLCGGHISPILTSANRCGIRVVDVRDEATAVFAADAMARLSGTPGVAAVTAGPGLTNTITAVKNAQLAQSPVVILGGAAPTVLKGKGALQDIDQMKLMRPHVKYAKAVRRVRDLAPALKSAYSIAQQGVPGPAFVECPIDLLYDESTIRGWYGQAAPSGGSVSARLQRAYLDFHLQRQFAAGDGPPLAVAKSVQVPHASQGLLAKVAAAVTSAKQPLLVIGSQAMLQTGPTDKLARAVEQLGVPVYLSGMARGLLGRNHLLHMRHKRRLATKESDCVLLAGVPCDFRLNYGSHLSRRATLVSVNRSRSDMTMNRRPTIGVLADAGEFLSDLADACQSTCPVWIDNLRARDDQREEDIATESEAETAHVNPIALLREIDAVMDDDSIIVADGGDFVATASYIVRPRAPLSWLDPGAFGTLGAGAGFAIGAKLHRPDSETWVIYGDGAFGYSLAEFESFVRLKIPIIAIIGNDACWSQIAREQVKLLHDDIGTRLEHSDYHLAAEALGAKGFLIETPEQTRDVLLKARRAATEGNPVLVNALLGASSFREGSISM